MPPRGLVSEAEPVGPVFRFLVGGRGGEEKWQSPQGCCLGHKAPRCHPGPSHRPRPIVACASKLGLCQDSAFRENTNEVRGREAPGPL